MGERVRGARRNEPDAGGRGRGELELEQLDQVARCFVVPPLPATCGCGHSYPLCVDLRGVACVIAFSPMDFDGRFHAVGRDDKGRICIIGQPIAPLTREQAIELAAWLLIIARDDELEPVAKQLDWIRGRPR